MDMVGMVSVITGPTYMVYTAGHAPGTHGPDMVGTWSAVAVWAKDQPQGTEYTMYADGALAFRGTVR